MWNRKECEEKILPVLNYQINLCHKLKVEKRWKEWHENYWPYHEWKEQMQKDHKWRRFIVFNHSTMQYEMRKETNKQLTLPFISKDENLPIRTEDVHELFELITKQFDLMNNINQTMLACLKQLNAINEPSKTA